MHRSVPSQPVDLSISECTVVEDLDEEPISPVSASETSQVQEAGDRFEFGDFAFPAFRELCICPCDIVDIDTSECAHDEVDQDDGADVEALRREISDMNSRFSSTMKSKDDRILDLEQRLTNFETIENELTESKLLIEMQQRTISELEQARTSSPSEQASIEKLSHTIENLTEELAKQKHDNSELTTMNQELLDTNQSLQSELDVLRQRLDELKSSSASQGISERANETVQHDSAPPPDADLINERNRLLGEVERLNEELSRRSVNPALEMSPISVTERADKLMNQVVKALKQQVALTERKEAELKGCGTIIKEMRDIIERDKLSSPHPSPDPSLQRSLDMAQMEIQELQKRVDDLMHANEDAQRVLAQKQAELLEQQRSNSSDEIAFLRKRIAELEESLETVSRNASAAGQQEESASIGDVSPSSAGGSPEASKCRNCVKLAKRVLRAEREKDAKIAELQQQIAELTQNLDSVLADFEDHMLRTENLFDSAEKAKEYQMRRLMMRPRPDDH